MKNNSNTLGLHNMNGLSADDKRTCALNDMNCRAGQPAETDQPVLFQPEFHLDAEKDQHRKAMQKEAFP